MGNLSCGCGDTLREEKELYTKATGSFISNMGTDSREYDSMLPMPLSSCSDLVGDPIGNYIMRISKDGYKILFTPKTSSGSSSAVLIFNMGKQISETAWLLGLLEQNIDLSIAKPNDLFQVVIEKFLSTYLNSVYMGAVVGEFRHGVGQEVWSDGTYYNGEHQLDMRSGTGTLILFDRTKYEGEFKDNCMEGYGKLTTSDGVIYNGGWKLNLKEGHGCETWPDGHKFVGPFHKGVKLTNGRYYWPNGNMSGVQ